MPVVRDLVREAFRTQEQRVDWPSGAAGALAVAGPLAAGLAVDEKTAALVAAIGGLKTALCVPRAGVRVRLWWGGLSVCTAIIGVALAQLAGRGWGVVPATLGWVGGWAFLRAAGPEGRLTGFTTSAVFVIMAGVAGESTPLPAAFLVLAWYLAGALSALALMAAVRRGPGRGSHLAQRTLRAVVEGARHDPVLRAHAWRVAVAVAAGTVVYRAIDIPHGAWMPVTTLAVLQPGERATLVRAIQRAAGTVGGAGLIVAITLATDSRWLLVAGTASTAFGLYALAERGYVWLVAFVTPTVLLLFSAVDFEGDALALDRIGGSLLGIVLGLVAGEAARWLGRPPEGPPGPPTSG